MRKSRLTEVSRDYGGGYAQGENSASGALTVTAHISSGASRYAMPSPSVSDFDYAALLYEDGDSPENPQQKDFAQGEPAEGGKLKFSFQRPDETDGLTLEVFAFKAGTTDFSKDSALLLGKKAGLKVSGDAIEVIDAVALSVCASSTEKGTVSLQIKVPDGCSLEIDDTTRFTVDGTSPGFILTQKETNGIPAGAYSVTFTVKKGGETIHIFSEYINVLPGMRTDTWWNGAESSAAKEITQSMVSSTVYVRGTGGWYDGPDYSATASDGNSGSLLSPFATIQKAVDTVVARNDGSGAYTICVDGTLACNDDTYIGTNGMADFSALDKNLTLTIKALSGTATLDANKLSRVINAAPASGALDLTLEKLTITGGNASESGGGVYIEGGTFTMNDCEISGNRVVYDSSSDAQSIGGGGVCVNNCTFDMHGGTISGNKVSGNTDDSGGGGVYVCQNSTFTLYDGTISGNTSNKKGGGIFVNDGTLTMKGGTIGGDTGDKNTASSNGGGVYFTGTGKTFTMEKGNISNNKSSWVGGGVFIAKNNSFIMKNGTISNNETSSIASGGGVYVSGEFTMEDGTIFGNTASNSGGGVCVYGIFTMIDGKIINNTANCNNTNYDVGGGGVALYHSTSEPTSTSGQFIMQDGVISGNTSKTKGGGIYAYNSTEFTMTGGTISGNKSTDMNKGIGAYIHNKFNISGDAEISEDNDVYLYSTKTIRIASPLTATAAPVATITPSAYTVGKQILSADDEATMQNNYSKFAIMPQTNDDGTKTKWKIAADADKGILKEDDVSIGNGISVVLPGQGTYTFKLEAGDTEIVEGSALHSGASVRLSEVKKDGVALTASDGTFSIEIRDGGENTLASATGFQCAVTVPAVPPTGMPMQVYVKIVPTSGIVVDNAISVTGA